MSWLPFNLHFYEYKCRCECTLDALRFWRRQIRQLQEVHFEFDGLLGGELTFKTILTRKQVLKKMAYDVNWHVMRQSLQHPDKYTGIRDTDIN